MREDVINLNIEQFFTKYKRIVEASISKREDYRVFKASDDISLQVLTKYAYLLICD